MSKEFTKSYAINRIAELNEQIVEMNENQNSTMKYLNKLRDENKQIKQQLTEKDKEIERLKQELEETNAGYDFTYEQSTETIKELKQNQTQLAIQELEKVKIMAGDLLEKFCSSWEYHQKYMRGHRHIEYYDLIQGIDNQIKELKGE